MRSDLKRLERDLRTENESTIVVPVAEESRTTSGSSVARDLGTGSAARVARRDSGPKLDLPSEESGHGRNWRWLGLALLLVVVAAVALGAWYWRGRAGQKLTGKDTIVVADFNNSTGEPVFDSALKQALTVDLEQSPFLNVLSDQKVNEQLRFMGHSSDSRLSEDLARQVVPARRQQGIAAGIDFAARESLRDWVEGSELPHRRFARE